MLLLAFSILFAPAARAALHEDTSQDGVIVLWWDGGQTWRITSDVAGIDIRVTEEKEILFDARYETGNLKLDVGTSHFSDVSGLSTELEDYVSSTSGGPEDLSVSLRAFTGGTTTCDFRGQDVADGLASGAGDGGVFHGDHVMGTLWATDGPGIVVAAGTYGDTSALVLFNCAEGTAVEIGTDGVYVREDSGADFHADTEIHAAMLVSAVDVTGADSARFDHVALHHLGVGARTRAVVNGSDLEELQLLAPVHVLQIGGSQVGEVLGLDQADALIVRESDIYGIL